MMIGMGMPISHINALFMGFLLLYKMRSARM